MVSRYATVTIAGVTKVIDLLSSAAPNPSTPTMLFGWSGADIPAVENQVVGTWMARSSWDDINSGHWIGPGMGNTGYLNYISAHSDRAADIGVPLIPHDSGTAYNTLLDQAIAGASVTVGGTTKSTDDIYTTLGAKLAQYGPQTVYARIWWEMNMSPDPQATIDRSKFIAAWNRAIPLIRAGFATQAPTKVLKIVFCPISDGAAYTAFYPDNDKVDVISMDVYGAKWTTNMPTSSELLSWTNGFLTSIGNFAISKGKPVSLGEWGNWGTGTQGTAGSKGRGDFPEYIDQVFDWAATYNAEYICYFNLESGGVGIDLNDQPLSTARIQQRVAALSS